MKTTVICHFFNEEYLLPWWLTFHREVFDCGIMIDYGSTDNSRAIIEDIVPHWQLVNSRNSSFDAPQVDTEVNDFERQSPGWKVALTITEFLCGDLRYATRRAESPGIRLRPVSLVDQEHYFGQEPERHLPIHKQRHHGMIDGTIVESRRRLLHRYSFGTYSVGRHCYDNFAEESELLTLVHLAYAPMTPRFIARKLQIQTKIPESNRSTGLGNHHFVDQDTILCQWRNAQKSSIHLPSQRFWRETTRVLC